MSWLFWYCIISHCVFTLILYKLTENLNNSQVKLPKKSNLGCQQTIQHSSHVQESSIWCNGRERSERVCKFRKLYYSPSLGEYLFFHGESSVLQGVPDQRASPALLDLSSVKDHNLQYFTFQDAPVSAVKQFSEVVVINEPSLLFHRFNPENLMHVIHDDLLPLFFTLRQYFPDFQQHAHPFKPDVQLVFMEGWTDGLYFKLYNLFSDIKPLLLADLASKSNYSLICFNEVTVGISKLTTWYDYGFHVPQGPIPNTTVDGTTIRQFTEYVTNKLGINSSIDSKRSDYVILFSRESNRLMINEFALTFSIATTFNLRVVRLSLENNKLEEIITMIQGSAGIIAMHGSILVLSMFLSPNTFLIELFPYAINPENYTPYKTLTQIPGIDISYHSWQNKIKNNTIAYPNRTKSEGGIEHLDKEMQKVIIESDKVPQHLCCDDPHWLFRIYQDTIVDVPSFIEVMKNALNATKMPKPRNYVKVYPGKIRTVSCKRLESKNGPALLVTWSPTWNMKFFNASQVTFEVWIQNISDQNYMAYSLQGVTEYTFDNNINYDTSYSIWVRGLINDKPGPFSDTCTCSTD